MKCSSKTSSEQHCVLVKIHGGYGYGHDDDGDDDNDDDGYKNDKVNIPCFNCHYLSTITG